MTSLTADHITEVWGILNGTTNYILTEMAEKGAAFADVLKEAQKLGYAEAEAAPVLKNILHEEPDLEVSEALRAALKALARERQK